MKKVFVVVILSSLILSGCKNKNIEKENINIDLNQTVSKIEITNQIVEYTNGNIELKFVSHDGFEDKTLNIKDKENLMKLLNDSEETKEDFRGPSSITVVYTNEENEAYEFKIWSENIFEFGQLGIPCPDMNCTKFYKLKNDFNLIKYFEKIHKEE